MLPCCRARLWLSLHFQDENGTMVPARETTGRIEGGGIVKRSRKTLADRVFYPLAAGAVALCALLIAIGTAVAWQADAAAGSRLLAGAVVLFGLTGGGSVWLIRLICRRYLLPVTKAVDIIVQAAAGDHSSKLSAVPRTSDEAAAMLDAAGDMGERRTGCLLEMETVLRRIGEGDLTACLPCGREAECGGACGALECMAQNLRGNIGSIRSALDQLAGRMDELERETGQLSQNAQDRRQNQEELKNSLERLNKRLDSRAAGVRAVSGSAEELHRRLADYDQRIGELNQAVERIADCAAEAGGIVKAMESTSFQCSVLARTAYVEAAGAGINGKGFALVASEMRVLASRSAQAAQDAAAFMEEMNRTIREGAALVDDASRELVNIAGSGQALCRRAAYAADEAAEIKEAWEAAGQVLRLTAAGAEDQLLASRTASSARLLQDRTSRLRDALQAFRLN